MMHNHVSAKQISAVEKRAIIKEAAEDNCQCDAVTTMLHYRDGVISVNAFHQHSAFGQGQKVQIWFQQSNKPQLLSAWPIFCRIVTFNPT